MESATYLVTVATDVSHRGVARLRRSAAHTGYEKVVVLTGDDLRPGPWRNTKKLLALHDYLTGALAARHPDTPRNADLVLFVDGYDVFVNDTPANFRKAWRRRQEQQDRDAQIVFASTPACCPAVLADGTSCKELYVGAERPDHYLNAGMSAGSAGAYRRWLALHHDALERANDEAEEASGPCLEQRIVHLLARKPPRYVALDSENALFYNHKVRFGHALVDFSRSRCGALRLRRTGKKPLVIHVTGANLHAKHEAALEALYAMRFGPAARDARSSAEVAAGIATVIVLTLAIVVVALVFLPRRR